MKKEVLISISGIQYGVTPGDEPLETVVAGEYYKRNGAHFLLYEEKFEGSEESVRNFVKLRGDSLEIRKRGLVNVHMLFEPGKKTLTDYQIPFGAMQLGISTTKVEFQEEEDHISAAVNYALDINEEYVADCEIHMDIWSRG